MRSWEAFWVPLGTILVIQGSLGTTLGSLGTTLEPPYGFLLIFHRFWDRPGSQFGSLWASVFIKVEVGNGADFRRRFLLISGGLQGRLDLENPSNLMEGSSKMKGATCLEEVTFEIRFGSILGTFGSIWRHNVTERVHQSGARK